MAHLLGQRLAELGNSSLTTQERKTLLAGIKQDFAPLTEDQLFYCAQLRQTGLLNTQLKYLAERQFGPEMHYLEQIDEEGILGPPNHQ